MALAVVVEHKSIWKGVGMKRLRGAVLVLAMCALSAVVWQTTAAARKISDEDAARARYAATIAKKWGTQIKRKYGMSPSEWTDKMIGTFTSSDIANLQRAANAKTFDGMSGALFGGSSAENMALARPLSIGSTENDLVFTPLPPCRILDTRVAGGALPAGGTRSFDGWTATDFLTQGGSSGNCGIPENASAVLANVVAVNTASRVGFLTAYPSNVSRPNAATINFVGSDIANQVALKLCRPGCPDQFSIYSTSQTHVVVDVYGYYMEPVATALDCVAVTELAPPLNLGLINVTAACPAGYTASGGGCGGPLGVTVGGSRPSVDEATGRPNGWTCSLASSVVIGLLGGRSDVTCCRIPGR